MIRHFIAFVGALVALLIYWVGYVSGANGWFWTAIGIVIVYTAIYNLVDA